MGTTMTNLPAISELAKLGQWVVYKPPSKAPLDARTRRAASSTNKETWAPFGVAVALSSDGYGLGFVFSADDPFCGIDLDHCFGPNHELQDWAIDIVSRLNSYTEYSPSGQGLHVWVKARLPEGRRRAGQVEMYDSARYFTVTGKHFPGTPETIECRQVEVEQLHAQLAPRKEEHAPVFALPTSLDDRSVLDTASRAANGAAFDALYRGDTSAYNGDDSAADLGLCNHLAFYTGRNAAQMDRLFRSSGLMREKWDTRRGDSTYGRQTIERAISDCREIYTPSGNGHAPRDWGMDVADAQPVEAGDEPAARNGYRVRNGRTIYTWYTPSKQEPRETVVADLWARITRDVVTDDGKRAFHIEGKTAEGRRFSFTIDASSFADDRALKSALIAAAGSRAGVHQGQIGHIGPSIQAFTPSDVPTINRLTRTGWRDSSFTIPGHELPDTEINLHGKLPYRLDANADLQRGIEALSDLLQAMPLEQSTVCLSALLQAPLAHLAGWRNERYALMVVGQTGSLKTSWMQMAMCLYGPEFAYDERILKWGDGATKNAICRIASGAADMPFFVDNYKPSTGGGSRDFVSMVHSLMEGGEKERLTSASELREARSFNCWPVFTGEDVPGDDAAALARALIVRFTWQHGEINRPLTQAQAYSGDLCAVGGAWISWLESPEASDVVRDVVSHFPEYRAQWAKVIVGHRDDTANALRIATNLATNQLTWGVACACPALALLLMPLAQVHTDGLMVVSREMAECTANAVEADRYLGALRSLLAGGKCVLWERGATPGSFRTNETMIGWSDGSGGAYLLPEVAMQQVLQLLGGKDALGNISAQKLYNQLDDLGALASKGRDFTAVVIKEQGRTVRTIHLTGKAIGNEGGGWFE
jgi:putative DNA primase/helicase